MGFDLLMEILVFIDNKEKFTKQQNKSILKYYRKRLKDKKHKRYLNNKEL